MTDLAQWWARSERLRSVLLILLVMVLLWEALCRGLVERGHQVLAFNRSHYPELQAMGVGQMPARIRSIE